MIEAAFRITDPKIPYPRPTRYIPPEEKGYQPVPQECKAWVDAQSLGIELLWSTAFTLTVRNEDGKAVVETEPHQKAPPIQNFADGYYSVATGCQILLPSGFSGLIGPHPRFYDPVPEGCYSDVPAIVPGLLELDWWPCMLFVVCSVPRAGTEHIFYAGEPFCQVIPVVRGDMAVRPMDANETDRWRSRADFLHTRRKEIATREWKSDGGLTFTDAYKVLADQIRKLGWAGVMEKYPR